ncbi:MAG: BrnT family toxin [Vicinamibacteria bacterium]|nr:BrnT family toxin [Vicinamibacteria bacterium]
MKAVLNVEKHGVSFPEAMTVFGDPAELTSPDPDHSEWESRFVSLGFSAATRLLVVPYIERDATIRIITAREASPKERKQYESNQNRCETEMRPEYVFSGAVRDKHREAYKNGTNVVFLDADVATAFTDSVSVNRALRLLLDLAREQASIKKSA